MKRGPRSARRNRRSPSTSRRFCKARGCWPDLRPPASPPGQRVLPKTLPSSNLPFCGLRPQLGRREFRYRFMRLKRQTFREGGQGLQADMNETELRIEEVIVEHALLPGTGNESGPFVAGHELERVAGFLSAEDADEPAFDALLAHQLFGPLVLLEGAGAVQIRAAGLGGEALGVLHEKMGILWGK